MVDGVPTMTAFASPVLADYIRALDKAGCFVTGNGGCQMIVSSNPQYTPEVTASACPSPESIPCSSSPAARRWSPR
jgi:hypothetical protein